MGRKSGEEKADAYRAQNKSTKLTGPQQARLNKDAKRDLGRIYPETKKGR